jgi:hypothetical protein
MARVLVCGSRYWNNQDKIRKVLSYYPASETTLIHGGCSGADKIAGNIATDLGWKEIKIFPANWSLYGRSAGPIRNQQMLDDGQPTVIVAFHPDITHSKGTKDMINRAKRKKIPVYIYN